MNIFPKSLQGRVQLGLSIILCAVIGVTVVTFTTIRSRPDDSKDGV